MPAAFPDAYGWGAEATGGRGGTVYYVTNTDNSGAGSLRNALEAAGARIIVFSVAGNITLTSAIIITNPYVTVAGQSAPGSGIVINGERLILQTHNAVFRYLSWMGQGGGSEVSMFTIRSHADGVNNIMIDHCSVYWGSDDNIDCWFGDNAAHPDIYNITVQNCILAEPPSAHPTNLLMGTQANTENMGTDRLHHISIHNNLFANCGHRNPLLAAQHSEVINNTVYNWQNRIGGFKDNAEVDWLANYNKTKSEGTLRFIRDNATQAYEADPSASVYIDDNIITGELTSTATENWASPFLLENYGSNELPSTDHKRTTRLGLPTYSIPILAAAAAYERHLTQAGNSRRLDSNGKWVNRRDSEDTRIIADVTNGTGADDVPDGPGTIPTPVAGTAYTDTDGDGMPDDYEDANSLDKNSASDGPTIAGNGYSNVENFLNGPNDVYVGIIAA